MENIQNVANVENVGNIEIRPDEIATLTRCLKKVATLGAVSDLRGFSSVFLSLKFFALNYAMIVACATPAFSRLGQKKFATAAFIFLCVFAAYALLSLLLALAIFLSVEAHSFLKVWNALLFSHFPVLLFVHLCVLGISYYALDIPILQRIRALLAFVKRVSSFFRVFLRTFGRRPETGWKQVFKSTLGSDNLYHIAASFGFYTAACLIAFAMMWILTIKSMRGV